MPPNPCPCRVYRRPLPACLLAGLLLVWQAPAVNAQETEEEYQAIPWSQSGSVTQRVGYTDIGIVYSRPVARGRTLFGGVVEWGRIWTPGADSATTVTLSNDVEIEGHPLPAGRYTLWMIPRPDGPWTVIFSGRTGILHAPYPGVEHDVLRFDAELGVGSHMEALAFYFPVVVRDSAVLRLHWGETVIPLAIEAPFEPYRRE